MLSQPSQANWTGTHLTEFPALWVNKEGPQILGIWRIQKERNSPKFKVQSEIPHDNLQHIYKVCVIN